MKALCNVIVNNMPKGCVKRYIVARYCVLDDCLWFHSTWDNENEAKAEASRCQGVVCILPEPYKAESEG